MTPSIYLVTIQDKNLYGEPDVGLAIVEAADEGEARHAADNLILELADQGRGRCVAHAREIDLGRFYRLSALVKSPREDEEGVP